MLRVVCTPSFTALPVGLHGMCGPVSEQQMDRSRGSYTFSRAIPTHTDSPRQSGGARKELGVLREWRSRSRYVARRGTSGAKRRVVESADAVHFHVGTTRIRSRHAVHGSWTALAGPAALRRRRRAEMLVGGHVRCDCERHGTLIENRSTTVDVQGARSYNAALRL